jgi:site-specific recombinase XerD
MGKLLKSTRVRGSVRAYTRHVPTCPHVGDSDYDDCRCPKWLYVNRNGKRTRYTLNTPSWAEASRIAEDTLDAMHPEIAAARNERAKTQATVMTVREACDLWIGRTERESGRSVVEQYKSLSNMLCRWATAHGIVNVQEITPLQLERWYSSNDWKKLAETTRYQRWGVLRSMFRYWKDRNVLKDSPIASIRAIRVKGSHVQGPYSDQQVTAILAAVPKVVPLNIQPEERKPYEKRLRTFINLLLHTGCDIGDGILFSPENLEKVNLDRRRSVYVYEYKRRKTGTDAVIPMPDWLVADLLNVPLLRGSKLELPFKAGKDRDLRWDVRIWAGRVDRAIKKAGVHWVELPTRDKNGKPERKDANVKQLRHTFAVRQLKAGQRPEDVARMMGHADGGTMIRKHYAPWVKDLNIAHITRVVAQRASR